MSGIRRRLRTGVFLLRFGLTGAPTLLEILSRAVTIVGGVIAVTIVVLALGEIVHETVTIQSFDVPEALAKRGYTSQAVAARLSDEIRRFVQQANNEGIEPRHQLQSSLNRSPISTALDKIEVPTAHTSLKTIATAVRSLLGFPSTTISGHIVEIRDRLRLHVRVDNEAMASPRLFDFDGSMSDPDPMIKAAAMSVVSVQDPFLTAAYQYNHFTTAADRAAALDSLNVALTKWSDDPRIARMLQLRARFYADEGDFDSAIRTMQDAVARFPRVVETRLQLAEYHTQRRQFDAALGQLTAGRCWDLPWYRWMGASSHRQAIETDRAYLLLGRWALTGAVNDRDQALTTATRAVELGSGPDAPWALNAKGDASLQFDRFEDAQAAYREGLERFPDAPEVHQHLAEDALRRGDDAEALAEARKARQLAPRWADPLLSEAYALIDLQHLSEAYEQVRLAEVLTPGSAWVSVAYGAIRRERHDFAHARDAFAEAVRRDPGLADSRANLGDTLYYLDDTKGAETEQKTAVELNQTLAWPRVGLAQISTDRGDFSEAQRLLSEAESLHPRYADAWRAQGDLWREQGLNDRAKESYQRAIDTNINRKWPDARVSLGDLLLEQGVVTDAEEQYRRASTETDHVCLPLIGLADAKAERGDTLAAAALFRKASDYHPLNPYAYEHWANAIRDNRGPYSDALRLYQRALLLAPDWYSAFVDLGILMELHGDARGAMEQFEKAIIRNGGNALAIAWRGLSKSHGLDAQAAATDFRNANNQNPGLAIRMFERGAVLDKEHRTVVAAKYYELAMRLAPETAHGIRAAERLRLIAPASAVQSSRASFSLRPSPALTRH
jgi:tetratricopeptide (TPR) repeat protein